MTARAAALGALLALGGLGCGETSSPPAASADGAAEPDDAAVATEAGFEPDAGAVEPEPVALVHSALWSVADAADDPFAPPAPARCPAGSFGDEVLGGELVFYVSTEFCPAITVQQASRTGVVAGDTLRVRLFHFPLTAPEPASAQLILRLGDQELLREEIPIPSDQAEITREWVAESDYARGTPLWFHVQNHGVNEYALISVERLRVP